GTTFCMAIPRNFLLGSNLPYAAFASTPNEGCGCGVREGAKKGAGRPRALLWSPAESSGDGRLAGRCGLVHLVDIFPIHQVVEEGLDVVRPPVSVIDVVGVLPHVATQNRFGTVHQWILAIRRFH